MMKRDEALRRMNENRQKLGDFFVKPLLIFGSVARDQATDASDIDLLVEFERPVGLFTFLRLQEYLEQLLGCRVDLATIAALGEEMREHVLKEAIRAA